ncbi:CBS domain-containing protein [Micromonosporaceae bacterium Da 78-11]
MRISDILRIKGERVVTVEPGTDVARLLAVLAEHRIGAVIVSADGTAVDGIVSERDIVRALAARGAGVLAEPVTAIHTTQVRTVEPQASLEDVERLMTEGRFRHVPVVVDGRLHGVVSIGDVVKNRIDELESERTSLSGYITGER